MEQAGLIGIGHLDLSVSGVDASAAWYENVLGLRRLRRVDDLEQGGRTELGEKVCLHGGPPRVGAREPARGRSDPTSGTGELGCGAGQRRPGDLADCTGRPRTPATAAAPG